jgi:ABC-type multidrug transport system fused ATPase/permease subunit
VSHTDPEPADGHRQGPAASPQDLYKQAFREWVKIITPWFFEFGSWVFGGLIAFTLLLMAPLITLGPVDLAVIVATAAFALALPLDVAGLLVLRLVQDMQRVGLEDEVARAFGEIGPDVGVPILPPSARTAQSQRRTERVLRVSFSILALSGALAVIGMLAVLWRMAWWIAIAFLAMVVISLLITSIAMAAAQPRDADEAKEQRRRSQEQRRRAREAARTQAQARDETNDERT